MAKMAALKSKVAAGTTEATQASGAQRAATPSGPAVAPPKRDGRPPPLQPVNFRGVALNLGEENNPLQAMAVLAHKDVSVTERHRADMRTGDRDVLASLARLPPQRQEQAVATLQMAAGTLPPPALLVWAAQEVGEQLRALLRERLAEAGAGADLTSEPWYQAALQLARLALESEPAQPGQPSQQQAAQEQAAQQPEQQQQQPAPAAPRTELQLLRSFAGLPADGAAAAAQPASPLASHVVQWAPLLSLPQLQPLLDAVAGRSPALATTLAVVGVRPSEEQQGLQAGATLLPQLRAATAAARARALEAAGLAPAAQPAEAPLDADAALTAIALGRVPTAAAAARGAAANWVAASSLLRHAEERLGCAGSGGPGSLVVSAMQLLGMPLEPPALAELEELRVSPEELSSWVADFAAQLTAAASAAGAAVAVPRALESRLSAARSRLAASGRALALLGTPAPAAGAAAAAAPPPEAAAAWLRAAGAPLASALLSGGYDSLRPLRAMAPELKEALLLKLLEGGRPGTGATALAAALYGDVEGALAAARSEAAGAAEAAEQLLREGIEAELDYVRDRFVPPPPATLPEPPALPSDAELAAAVRRLPAGAREHYHNYYALRPGGDGLAADGAVGAAGSSVALADAVKALLGGTSEGGLRELLDTKELQPWLTAARGQLVSVPRPLMSLLLRFVRVQMSVTPESAHLQRRKLLALLVAVGEQQARVASSPPVPAPPPGRPLPPATAASEAAAEAEALSIADAAAAETARGVAEGRMPPELARLLGEQGAQDFASWVQALALNPAQSDLSTQDLLAQQHMEMDVERYLTMSHDPRLHLPLGGLGPASPAAPTSADWTDPALRRGEGAWLEGMRPQLDAYLRAMGYRPMGDAEWTVYRDAALAEWEAGREAREERLAAAGASGFFNPRADEVYLQQLLEQSIPPDAPLGASSRRYLDTLIRNPSWSFAQRLQAVQRLVQLNDHFERQPPAPEEGSPFAPLFAPGGPDPVPRLTPASAAKGGKGERAPLRLPKGF